MKKIFTLCLFVFGFLLVTNTAQAQQKFSAEVNEAAQTKAVEFGRFLKADQATQESIYTAYQEFYAKSETLNSMLKKGTSDYADLETKLNQRLLSQMDEALTDEQYAKYLELTDQSGNQE
ncbi:hypothetical protein [Olleya aquimaris]|uniref:Uncharacterized protein n=1 Tax=Olleya aquimaris TaxID=639310 RepID=A0A327REP3_9FLAO|nr:hypothetical protein [Olleya aquimaris]RAJ14605.1 hypothetical protein LY08_01784 [Olleya aquimaris]